MINLIFFHKLKQMVLYYRNTMEEQTTDIEVTVKTLDSQSRTYTVRSQVNVFMCIAK